MVQSCTDLRVHLKSLLNSIDVCRSPNSSPSTTVPLIPVCALVMDNVLGVVPQNGLSIWNSRIGKLQGKQTDGLCWALRVNVLIHHENPLSGRKLG